MARLIDGKEIAESIYENINLRARELRGRGVIPGIQIIRQLKRKTRQRKRHRNRRTPS